MRNCSYGRTPIKGRWFPCPARARTFGEVQYSAFGKFIGGNCSYDPLSRARSCQGIAYTPMVLSSLDEDAKTRQLVPLAFATGGFVDLITPA